ncbi:NAD-dependent epimerase/dehydratase family protein [Specibacter cremeus]|uniref:NAD-dependent epimerase/dehydratase family protein n=1 Tax=Specibacter cremeus TaxID=1629051 RepID=UPI00197B92ED|nr:NAD-dependent epimerase/dehydratase family protein [Specibacter cremeus]
MTPIKLVTGAGPVGWTVATQLADAGHRVRIVTRSGSGPDHPLIERRAADASDTVQLRQAMEGVDAVFHCIHGSRYRAETWRAELPDAERAVQQVAGEAGAVVAFPESLYSYSTPDDVMTETGPRTAHGGKRGVRTALLDARAASGTPTVTVVASDFYGPRVLAAHAGERMVPAVMAGRRVIVLGSATAPHSFTYIGDLAAAMITAAARPELWNGVWHAPTVPPVTQRQMGQAFATAAGAPAARINAIPGWVVRAAGLLNTDMRELAEMLYQLERPFVMDSRRSEEALGLAPTSLADGAAATVAWWRDQR